MKTPNRTFIELYQTQTIATQMRCVLLTIAGLVDAASSEDEAVASPARDRLSWIRQVTEKGGGLLDALDHFDRRLDN